MVVGGKPPSEPTETGRNRRRRACTVTRGNELLATWPDEHDRTESRNGGRRGSIDDIGHLDHAMAGQKSECRKGD